MKAFALGLWLCVFATPLLAEMRAILVGVSDYDDSIGLADLKGPANDVRLLADVLNQRGVQDLVLLADGVDGGIRPTRTAILGALEAMTLRAGEGDLIYIHMSGHGTRQTDLGGDETDGLDEVFLPADTARAEPGAGVIPNAIVDDEIGAAVRALRNTGADVWLVLDSCHSGSGLRAGSPGTATRYVDPSVLGLTLPDSQQTEVQLIETPDETEPPGGFLAFYSARSNELAREVSFPSEDGGAIWYGLFTSKLAARLQSGEGLSYRQLFQAVLSDMNDSSVPGGARLQTPLWEGSLIDAAVFGGQATSGVRRFAILKRKVQAGKLHGLSDGTVLGLVADPADPPEAIIGYAQMRRTKATQASLRAVSPDCVPNSQTPCDQAGALPPEARYAQVMARPVDLVIRIAPPRDIATDLTLGDNHPASVALMQALTELGAAGPNIVLDASDYDVESYLAQGQLWFGARARQGNDPLGLAVEIDPDELIDALLRMARAEELARLLGSVAKKPSGLSPNPLTLDIKLNQVDVGDLQINADDLDPYEECEIAHDEDDTPELELPASATLKQCDQLAVRAQGKVAGTRDVNRIHIDARFCVHASYERIEDTAQMRQIGHGMVACSDCPDGYSAGHERMFIVVTEAETNREALNLEGLVETCAATAGATRGAAQTNVISFLTGLAQGPNTRGSFGSAGASDVWVTRYDWSVMPRAQAFLRAGRDPETGQ
ncbi:MAG: caspase domain-containing protein [Sedimentitalea sp.]